MDFNHPAAGKDIVLKVKIMEVREPSFAELMASMNLFKGGG
jgi:FKBP-type peptidyl-prolyl cis-trans isomerase 2